MIKITNMEKKDKKEKTQIVKKKLTVLYTDLLPIAPSKSKVFVHSLPKKSVLGIDLWTNDSSGKRLNKTKIGNRANDKYPAFYSSKVGGLLNGLSYKPWMHEGLPVVNQSGAHMTLQDKMEIKWNLDKGFLNNRAWKKGDSLVEADLNYYTKQSWTFKDGSTVFDLATMEGELGYYTFLDSSRIANSLEELHKWPKATHYISHEGESDQIKYKKTAKKSKAFGMFYTMTLPLRRKLVHILELASTRGGELTEEQIQNLLFEFIDKSTYTTGSNLDKFLELSMLNSSAQGKEQIEARYIIKKALDARVIYEKQGAYNWPRPDGLIVIGDTLPEVIEFILSPKKTVLVEELEKEISSKLSF